MDDLEIRRLAAEAFRQMDQQVRHPSIEEIGSLVRGEPSGAARVEVENHLAECTGCRQRKIELEQFLADCDLYVPGEPSADLKQESEELLRRVRRRKSLAAVYRWGGIAAMVIAAIALSWLVIRMVTPSPAQLLAKAYKEQRSFDYRLAGAEYAAVRRQRGGQSAFELPVPLLKAQARLAEELQSNPDNAAVLRLTGQAEMIRGDAGAAVHTLERARDLQPLDARLLADLGAAYALRGDIENQPGDHLKALDSLGRSLKLQPNVLEVIFNLALVLERMSLKDQAIEKWEEYLRLDGASEWANEARQHLNDLKAELRSREDALGSIVDDPSRFLAMVSAGSAVDAEAYIREIVITRWLPRIGSDATAHEATIRAGQLLAQRHGDPWLTDLIASGGGAEMTSGLQKLAAARASNLSGRADAALAAARDAQQSLLRAGSQPGILCARQEEIAALRGLFKYEDCIAMAGKLSQDLAPHPYVWIRAELQIEYGVCALRLGRLSEAAAHLREAIQLSRAAGLGDTSLRAVNMHLSTLQQTGLPSEVFTGTQDSLGSFWNGPHSPRLYYQVVDVLRDIAGNSDQHYAALYLARSAVWAASADANVLREAMARANLAVTAQAVNEPEEARESVEISDKLFAQAPPGYSFEPQVSLARVEMKRGETDSALKRLEKVGGELPAGPSLSAVDYYSALGEAYRQKGLAGEAIGAFRKSIDFGKQRLASLTAARDKPGELRTVEASYRGLIAAMLALPDNDSEALRVWQSYRALDSAAESGRLGAPGAPILWFVELPDGYVSWLDQRDRVLMHRFDVSKETVASVVVRFRRACSDAAGGRRGLLEDARQLYRWMIGPFVEHLDGNDQALILELDGVLAAVPVQALVAGEGGYIGERFSVLVSSGYATSAQVAKLGPTSAMLFIANPTVTGKSASRFPPWSDSWREAEAVRSIFSNTTLLSGRDASIEALMASLPGADIIHFAGHGYTERGDGALIFTPRDSNAADYELLRSGDLRGLDWSRCRLAVLSACATAAGEARGSHNPDSLVRALARAGVARIAASLWSVDSSATADLMRAFYLSLALGASPADALRQAQHQMRLQRPAWNHPYYWAGFQLYGTI